MYYCDQRIFSERIMAFDTAQLPITGIIGVYLQVQGSYKHVATTLKFSI